MKRLVIAFAVLFALLAGPLRSETPKVPANAPAHAGQSAHAAADAHGEGHSAPKTYFGIPAWILKFVNMVLFWGLLIYFIAGPIRRTFSARGERIREDLKEAESRRRKADQMAGDIQARLAQIEADVAAVLKRAEDEGERQKREMIEAAEHEAQKILTTARTEVDARVKAARKELTDYARELSADSARALIERQLTDEDRRKIFSESVEQLAGGRS
jgi:F-type H+-transporting ATPase subunit b